MIKIIQYIFSSDFRMTQLTFLQIIDKFDPDFGVRGSLSWTTEVVKNDNWIGALLGFHLPWRCSLLSEPFQKKWNLNFSKAINLIWLILLVEMILYKLLININGIWKSGEQNQREHDFSFGSLPFPNIPSILFQISLLCLESLKTSSHMISESHNWHSWRVLIK